MHQGLAIDTPRLYITNRLVDTFKRYTFWLWQTYWWLSSPRFCGLDVKTMPWSHILLFIFWLHNCHLRCWYLLFEIMTKLFSNILFHINSRDRLPLLTPVVLWQRERLSMFVHVLRLNKKYMLNQFFMFWGWKNYMLNKLFWLHF